jgi:hypothetical protein
MATKPQSGTCALCLNFKELRKSHITSRFLWRQSGVIGDKKTFPLSSPTHPELDEPYCQDGLKEFLLCHVCEQQFSGYENYAARALFDDYGPIKNRPKRHFVWTGLDYTTLKLFQMSILWRMGVSSHPFYCNVELGKHAESLRSMLHAGDPGEPWQYGCMATLLEHGGEALLGIFSQPLKSKKFGHHCYIYTIAGMTWVQFVTSHLPDAAPFQAVLQISGRWVLFRGGITDFAELRWQVEQHRKQHEEAKPVGPNRSLPPSLNSTSPVRGSEA